MSDRTAHANQSAQASVNEASPFVDVSGITIPRKAASGACRRCGYTGHLAFQCYNFLKPKQSNECVDVSSTSSESDYETPLTAKKKKSEKHKKKKKHSKHGHKTKRKHKRKRSRSRSKEHKSVKRKKTSA